jgi:hypothetical protein
MIGASIIWRRSCKQEEKDHSSGCFAPIMSVVPSVSAHREHSGSCFSSKARLARCCCGSAMGGGSNFEELTYLPWE